MRCVRAAAGPALGCSQLDLCAGLLRSWTCAGLLAAGPALGCSQLGL